MSVPTDPWYSRNALRHYPLLDGSSPPVGLFVDAGFVVDPDCGLVPSVNSTRVLRIDRVGGGYRVSVATDAAVDRNLTFFIPDGWGEWLTVRDDPEPAGSGSSSVSSGGWTSPAASWFGFVVVGRETDWQAYLPSGSVTFAATEAVFEPARTALGRTRVRSVRIANQQRLRASPSDACDPLSAASQTVTTDLPYVEWGPPLTGPEIVLVEGHNLTVRTAGGRLSFSARPGYGDGPVCDEIPLRPNEEPPPGSVLLTGGPTCGELVRLINGLPGKTVRVVNGVGIRVTPDVPAHTVIVSVDPSAFDRWPSFDGSSSSSASSTSSGGP